MEAIILLIIYLLIIWFVISSSKSNDDNKDNYDDINYYIDNFDDSYKDYTDSLNEDDYKHLK